MTSPPISDSRLANLGAGAVADVYREVESRFQIITRRARKRFESRDWAGMAADATQRLDVYGKGVTAATAEVTELLGDRLEDKTLWTAMKAVFSGFAMERQDFEVAETFFNSVTRRVFDTLGVDPRIEFVDTDFDTPPTESPHPVFRTYTKLASTRALVRKILDDARFRVPFRSLEDDVEESARMIEARLVELGARPVVDRAEIVDAVFYRGKGAYIVGRAFSGSHVIPVILALVHKKAGIVVDAALLSENQVSILFSFAHSYFHVEGERPYDLVRFLRSQVPRKRLSELYISLGRSRHGKTELFRELLDHLRKTEDRFEEPQGQPGLVMSVFTLPGFEMVFKVIKDHFPPQKTVTPTQVMEKYRLVFRHDRAGRLVDSQPFEHLQFDVRRFEPAMLDSLLDECGRSVQVEDSTVNVSLAYAQRRVIPLDVYLKEAPFDLARPVVLDYGCAIKDLASSGVFPGDLLLKNFGVTRNGRVVFYDYDELVTIADCNFRRMPPPSSYEDELAAEPWFSVGPNDVFPEEFASFLGIAPELREAFETEHSDLYKASWWIDTQDQLAAGKLISIYPYGADQRLSGVR